MDPPRRRREAALTHLWRRGRCPPGVGLEAPTVSSPPRVPAGTSLDDADPSGSRSAAPAPRRRASTRRRCAGAPPGRSEPRSSGGWGGDPPRQTAIRRSILPDCVPPSRITWNRRAVRGGAFRCRRFSRLCFFFGSDTAELTDTRQARSLSLPPSFFPSFWSMIGMRSDSRRPPTPTHALLCCSCAFPTSRRGRACSEIDRKLL